MESLSPEAQATAEWSSRAIAAAEDALHMLRLAAGVSIQYAILRAAAAPSNHEAELLRTERDEWKVEADFQRDEFNALALKFRELEVMHEARQAELEGALADAQTQANAVEPLRAAIADGAAFGNSRASAHLAKLLDAIGANDVAVALRRIRELRTPASAPAAAELPLASNVCFGFRKTFVRPKGPGAFKYCEACRAPRAMPAWRGR